MISLSERKPKAHIETISSLTIEAQQKMVPSTNQLLPSAFEELLLPQALNFVHLLVSSMAREHAFSYRLVP